MTFKEFRDVTTGVDRYQVYMSGKWFYEPEILSGEFDDKNVVAFDFKVYDCFDTIVCTVDLI